MAERVAPGHLKINDENLAADAKYAFLNVKSKNSKTDGKDGGSGIAGQKRKSEALDDNTKERSPQPEASSKEDFLNVEEEGPERKRKALDDDTKKNSLQTQASPKEEDLINKYKGMPLHAHSKCIHSAEKQRAARMMRMRLTQKKKFPQKNEDGCISIQGLKKAHVFLQFSTSPELSIPVVPAGFTGNWELPYGHELITTFDLKGVWTAMEECQKQGLTKSIGVEMNPALHQKKLTEYCEAKGIIITAFSPLGAKGTSWGTNAVMDSEILKEIAEAHGKSVAQICLRWLYEKGVTMAVKSYNKERMKQNLEVFEWSLARLNKSSRFVSTMGQLCSFLAFGMGKLKLHILASIHCYHLTCKINVTSVECLFYLIVITE